MDHQEEYKHIPTNFGELLVDCLLQLSFFQVLLPELTFKMFIRNYTLRPAFWHSAEALERPA
jgi:hypothetical protein